MPRIYLTNDSYPELRNLPLGWARSSTWWRAIARAARHLHFWVFVGAQVLLIAVFVTAVALVPVALARLVFVLAAVAVFAYLQVSWGGDMMRRHLRAVSEEARYACPFCGQSLYAHVESSDEGGTVRCPECAAQVSRAVFRDPYPIPPESRAFPPWKARRFGADS